jgi:hypothetical protein
MVSEAMLHMFWWHTHVCVFLLFCPPPYSARTTTYTKHHDMVDNGLKAKSAALCLTRIKRYTCLGLQVGKYYIERGIGKKCEKKSNR